MANLSASKIKSLLDSPGRHSLGDGLILFVRSPGQASWVCRVQHDGRRRDYGLGSSKIGSPKAISLADARKRSWDVRDALAKGEDPKLLPFFRTGREKSAPLRRTFKEATNKFLSAKEEDAGEKRKKQRKAMLEKYVLPDLGKLQVGSIDAERIAECLRPIWKSKPETARQLLSLIVRTLRVARPDGPQLVKTLGPAVADLLGKQPEKGNFDAIAYQELPALMRQLETKAGVAALALRFTILTACRSGEVRGATWDEIDFDRALWSVPPERTKTRKPHYVPLSAEALAVLKLAAQLPRSKFVFPSNKSGALSDMALTKRLRDMGLKCTAHGMRSAFRDWAAERGFKDDWAEAALAHTTASRKGDTVAAYLRTTFFNDRRDALMPAWGAFAVGNEPSAEVKPFPKVEARG